MTPLVTIGMPVFQNAGTLARAIASVRKQTMADWHLIITDDGSADQTVNIAQAAANEDARIELIRNDLRLGYMNFGVSLKQAKSEWFVWLAGDDFWSPRFLEAALAAADADPESVSVLPRWAYTGMGENAPRTLPLDGPHTTRVRRFLAAPGGTRMYGLTRRSVMQAAFPAKSFNAFDWYLVLGVIRSGRQIELDECLLFRERTPLRTYVETADCASRGIFRWFPILRMSLAAVRDGRVHYANAGDLLRLNLRKYEERLAYLRPVLFAQQLPILRRLGSPIASKPGRAREIAEELVREVPERRSGAARLLARLVGLGEAAAATAIGKARRDGLLPGDSAEAFARGKALGDTDAGYFLAEVQFSGGTIGEAVFWAEVIDAATLGSEAARSRLIAARASGELPESADQAFRFRVAV